MIIIYSLLFYLYLAYIVKPSFIYSLLKVLLYIYIYIYIYILIYPLDDISIHCTELTVDIMGHAVDSLYPPIELNDTIREVINFLYFIIYISYNL